MEGELCGAELCGDGGRALWRWRESSVELSSVEMKNSMELSSVELSSVGMKNSMELSSVEMD
jgi:hypothetical protein